MAVIRKHSENQYTKISNTTLRSDDLSWEATGMLAYLLSHSNQFKISIASLARAKQNGMNATRRILKELREKGYIHFSGTEKDDKGCWAGSIWDIFEEPQGVDPTLSGAYQNRTENVENDVKTSTADNETADICTAVPRHALEGTIKELTIKKKQSKDIRDESQKIEVAEIVEQPKTSRQPNLWIEAWMNFMGVNPEDLSKREWKAVHDANKEIKSMGQDIEALKLRMAQYSLSKTFKDMERTPNAIMRHWSRLGRAEDVTEHLNRERDYDRLSQRFIDAAKARK